LELELELFWATTKPEEQSKAKANRADQKVGDLLMGKMIFNEKFYNNKEYAAGSIRQTKSKLPANQQNE
jgi:hypothetical protein